MSNNPLLLLAGTVLTTVMVCGPALLLRRQYFREDAFAARVATARGLADPVRHSGGENLTPLRLIARLGLAIVRSGLLSERTLNDLQQTLVTSGFKAENALGLFVGGKLVLVAVLAAVAFVGLPAGMAPIIRNLLTGSAAVAGMLMPDYLVRYSREAYRKRLERGIPDALDLMVVCAQAGLSMQPTLARVAEEIRPAHAEVAIELALTASEMQVMVDSRTALLRLGERTGLASLRRLTATLAQSIQYGTPLSDAMRALAAEMRQEMLIAFEERAARLPVFLTMPMVLFILPCVMMVVGGPAVIQLFRVMSH